MTIEIPDQLLAQIGISIEALMLKLAIELFKEEKITLGQGSQLAGIHQIQFQRELAKCKIPIHYDIEDFEEDMKTLAKLRKQ